MSNGAKIRGANPLTTEQLVINNIAIEQKQATLRKVLDSSSYKDSTGALHDELKANLDFDGYESFCYALITAIDEADLSFDGCLKLLKQHFSMLIDESICKREHFYRLLNGSILHMQAMLTQILYEAFDEKDGIADFKVALTYYREFLQNSIAHYREKVFVPHYYDPEYLKKLSKFKC